MYKYISDDKPNRVRQPELDLAKFIAIFLMIICHCGIYFFESDTVEYIISDLIGGEFAAPVFMVCMGIGTVFSRHNKPQQLIARGLNLMILGYALNIVRGTLPMLIVRSIDDTKIFFTSIQASFYMVDILQFAGLAMILLGLFKKWKVEPVYQMLTGILMAGLGDILAELATGNEWIDAVLDLVWGANDMSFFPVLNWFIYPAAGVVFGEILMHCNDKAALYRRLLPIGAAGVAMSYYLLFTEGEEYYAHGSYYFMGIKNVVYGLCFPILQFSVCYFITEKINTADNRFIAYSSKNLNTIYCISWVFILWIYCFVRVLFDVEITGLLSAFLMVLVLAGSYGLCQVWLNIKKKKETK